MSLFVMDMPESHAELVDWLEEHLVGLDLAALVAELSAVHGSEAKGSGPTDATSIVNLLQGRIPDVIESGLTVLDTQQVRELLQHPRSLLELQELVLTSGGAHWEKRMEDTASPEFQRIADSGWRRMKLAIAPPAGSYDENGAALKLASDTVSGTSTTKVPRPTVRISEAREQRQAAARSRSVWPAVIGTAAMLMLGLFGLDQAGLISVNLNPQAQLAQNQPVVPHPVPLEPTASQGWGWDRPGAIPTGVAPETYLNTLAHAADEWFNKRPTNRAGVEQRITDFRNGCSTLIAASHEPLADEDRAWLVDKCKLWRDKLDAQLTALEAGDDPHAVRASADETITNLITAMRTRANEVA